MWPGTGIDLVAGIDARGFILGGALAMRMGKGFVPIRKCGKLPAEVYREEYALEYGTDEVEIHKRRDPWRRGDGAPGGRFDRHRRDGDRGARS